MKASETIESLNAIKNETLLPEVDIIIKLLVSLLNNFIILKKEKKYRKDAFFSSDIILLKKAFMMATQAIEKILDEIIKEVI